MKRRISTETFDVQCGQGICFGGGVFVLAATGWKLSTLDLTTLETLDGLLLASAVSLLLIIMGIVLPLTSPAVKKPSE